jgi:hypothetical protein
MNEDPPPAAQRPLKMIDKRRATAYQLPPISSPGTIDKRNKRRRSTSEIQKRRSVDVEVRPIVEESSLLAGRCGRVTIIDGQAQFTLTSEHSALERRLLKEAANTISNNRGADIQSIISTKPRSRMILDLDAPVWSTSHPLLTRASDSCDEPHRDRLPQGSC